jgi:hypothetical protein
MWLMCCSLALAASSCAKPGETRVCRQAEGIELARDKALAAAAPVQRWSFSRILISLCLIMLVWSFAMMTLWIWLFGFGFLTLQVILSFLLSAYVFHAAARLSFLRKRIRRADLVAIDYLALLVAGSALLAIADLEREISRSWAENTIRPGVEYSRRWIRSRIDAGMVDYWCNPPPAWRNTQSNCNWMKEAQSLIRNGYEPESWHEFLDKSYAIYGINESKLTWWQGAASVLCLGDDRFYTRDGIIISALDRLFCEPSPTVQDVAMIEGVIHSMQDYHEREVLLASLIEIASRERDPFISYIGYFMLATALAVEFARITARRSGWYPE